MLASLMSGIVDHAARRSARRRGSATGRDGSARAMSAEGAPRSDRSSRALPREGQSRSRSPYNPQVNRFLGNHSWNEPREPTGATTGASSGQPQDHLADVAAFDAYKPKALKRRSTRRAPPKIAREGGSKGVATLLDAWGTGDVPGNVVFRVVTNFADDLENMTEDIVASMKTLSLSPGTMDSRNCSRNLIRRFTLGGKLPEPIQVECPMKVPRKGGTTMGKVWVIAPHELFAMLHDNYKAEFDKRIGTLEQIKE